MGSREQVTELLNQLEKDLKELEFAYEQYFLGMEKRSPEQQRSKFTLRIRKMVTLYIPQTDLRFRLQSITSRFNSYSSYWDRIQRLIDEGKYERHTARIQRYASGKPHGRGDHDDRRGRPGPAPLDSLYEQLVDSPPELPPAPPQPGPGGQLSGQAAGGHQAALRRQAGRLRGCHRRGQAEDQGARQELSPSMTDQRSKTAMILAGGGIMGAAYEIGCLAALDRLFVPGFSTRRFDTYIGISAGSVIATLVANRIDPGGLFKTIARNEMTVFNWRRRDIYRFDWWAMLRSLGAPAPQPVAGSAGTTGKTTGSST